MSTYTKTIWKSGAAPGISADKLNHLETQYDCAKDDLDAHVAAADPHGQYPLKSILTSRGDIIYRGSSNWQRLPKGSSGQVLTMGASDPKWEALPQYVTVASDQIYHANDTERQVITTTTYVKVKEIKVNVPLQEFKVRWSSRNLDTDTTYTRVYVNGVAVSPEYENSASTLQNYEYTLSSASVNDLIQIYLRSSRVICYTIISNFRLCLSLVPVPFPTNQDPT